MQLLWALFEFYAAVMRYCFTRMGFFGIGWFLFIGPLMPFFDDLPLTFSNLVLQFGLCYTVLFAAFILVSVFFYKKMK